MKKFILLSDIHATNIDPSSPEAPSYVSSVQAGAYARKDPLDELESLINNNKLAPDYILCAGDITNRSDPAGLKFAWEKLNKIANNIGSTLITTVGNHDLDSRFIGNRYNPRGYVMSLDPKIPISNRTNFLEYWAENYTLITDDGCNILVLNTAAYHGGGKPEHINSELEHGRISEVTVESIKKTISSAPEREINILLCHHHPIKGELGDEELEGLTRGGDKLVEILQEVDSDWILVHGHKHAADLLYGHGGSESPLVIACGSFSAQVNKDAQNKNPNQVHLLVCDPSKASSEGLDIAGYIQSWNWVSGLGWKMAGDSFGLPDFSGFGYRGSPKKLATEIIKHFNATGSSFIPWKELVATFPLAQRMIPSDFRSFEKALNKGKISLLRENGMLSQVGKSNEV